MKKTLFAMMALALCGTAFAGEYYTSSYNNGDNFTVSNEAVTLNVDKTVAFDDVAVNTKSNPLVLNFVGSNTFSAGMDCVVKGNSVTSITGDAAAVTSWETALLETPDTAVTITLASGNGMSTEINLNSATFMGKSANQTLTLGNTELTYVGYKSVYDSTGMDNIKDSLGDNQIALVGVSPAIGQKGGIYIVGKATAPVPEPATATLSLLALAGLAARRKRQVKRQAKVSIFGIRSCWAGAFFIYVSTYKRRATGALQSARLGLPRRSLRRSRAGLPGVLCKAP